MKRPILGFLAAALLSFGLLGPSPAQAATPNSPHSLTAATVTPAHDSGEEHSHKHSSRYEQGGTRHHDHDWDDDGHDHDRRRRCSGLIVICLV